MSTCTRHHLRRHSTRSRSDKTHVEYTVQSASTLPHSAASTSRYRLGYACRHVVRNTPVNSHALSMHASCSKEESSLTCVSASKLCNYLLAWHYTTDMILQIPCGCCYRCARCATCVDGCHMLRSHIVCFVEGCAGTDKVASRQLNEILRLMRCLTFAIRGLFSTQVPALRQSVSGQADFTLQISGRLQLRAVTPTKISPLPEHQRSQVIALCNNHDPSDILFRKEAYQVQQHGYLPHQCLNSNAGQ